MPRFDTPEPISVLLELGVTSEVRVIASDRTDTRVEVRPTDESDDSDVRTAQQVTVEYASGVLRVQGPKVPAFDFSRKTRSVDVVVELPTGSHLTGSVQLGDLNCVGRLAATRFKTSTGHIHLEHTGPLHVDTAHGHVTVAHVEGDAEIHTGSGKVSLGRIEGTSVVRNSNGDIRIDTAGDHARLRSSNGGISVERAEAGLAARTANGSVRVGEATRDAVTLETALGGIEVGIAAGTAAWLEVATKFGRVRNLLDEASGPKESEVTVEVRARTSHGDITIRRA
ncbi:DUF4097 family beta strand repeat-containing protein [Actinoalloteichus spitiensis]|uniref:DUF4097 family beta strand repeat-containing protein n=1 Tax=Actinoalloteichus spitiensis TaxID=252394 RepID=UPI00035FB355|nr:DUF4097 family beta strand repeat-containing protein [Actinoalloteichus spitiensis]